MVSVIGLHLIGGFILLCHYGGNCVVAKQQGNVVCGGVFNASKGVIHTPNFPGPYPTPIYCEWLIHAPPGKKIIIYFTQYYMKDSFYVTEYEYYQDTSTYIGRHDLGRISWEHDLLFLVAWQPYVLIQFNVESIGNRHLRVIDHLLEVYGFNITYEILDKPVDLTKKTCSVKECSYLGNCLVSADYAKYECQCFEDFFGPQCQYGPYCDPDNNINQCTNGGRCKYFFGSLINQCECLSGFAGAYCEIPASGNGPELDKECQALKCSHLCDVIDGKAYCVCYDGYKMHEDNGTCIPIARYRMDVTLELQSFISINQSVLKERLEEAKEEIMKTIEKNGVSTITKFGMKGLRNSTTTTVMEFHFYCKVSEVDGVETALDVVVGLDAVGIFKLRHIKPKYEPSPELLLSEVTNYDPKPTLRGTLLTLVCAAKGSKNISFHWYKDDHIVDTSLTQRNAWETVIPHTVHGMQLSALNIDNVSPLDAGMFTCEVTDFGETQWGNVAVTVNDYPKVELDPMSLSVQKFEPISIKCLSPDDSWLKFLYEWFKDGVQIDPKSKNEYAEDMFPTGVRLVVPSIIHNAQYTCRVTNKAGAANVSSYVHVVSANETLHACLRNYEGQVMWQNTSGGHFDIQICPTEQGDYIRYGTVNIGYARRHCKCDEVTGVCSWSKPNFAKCQSLVLIHIFDELELLRYGYQRTTLKKVFVNLSNFIHPKNQVILYSGDIDMVANILKDLMLHMKNFPSLVKDDTLISLADLVELMSAMLLRSSTATDEEKVMLLVGPCIVIVSGSLFSGNLDSLDYTPGEPVTTGAVDMKFQRMKSIGISDESNEHVYKSFQKRFVADEYDVPTLNVLTFTSNHLYDLLSYRDTSPNKQKYSGFASQVYTMGVYEKVHYSSTRQLVQITLEHETNLAGLNRTVCLSWHYESSSLYNGKWVDDDCTVVETTRQRTVCNCKLPGHFVAAIIPDTEYNIEGGYNSHDINVALLICYSVSLVITFIAVVVYLKTISVIVGDIHIVHCIFICSIFIATMISVICLVHTTESQSLRSVMRILMVLCFLVAFTCLTLDVFHMVVMVYDIKQIQLTNLKCLIGCLGIPVIFTLAIFVILRTMDQTYSTHMFCWLPAHANQFYAYMVVVGLIVVGWIICVVMCLKSLITWTDEWKYCEKQKYMKAIGKSALLLVFLLSTNLLGVGIQSSHQYVLIGLHATFYICLCVSTLVLRCVLNKQIRFVIHSLCCGTSEKNPKMKSMQSSSSFRAFMKPEQVPNVAVSEEQYNVSKYYEEVNRTKYTKERKRELSSLLGSSSSGENSSETRSVTVSGTSTNGSKESEILPSTIEENDCEMAGNDSGIFDYSDATGVEGARGGENNLHQSNEKKRVGKRRFGKSPKFDIGEEEDESQIKDLAVASTSEMKPADEIKRPDASISYIKGNPEPGSEQTDLERKHPDTNKPHVNESQSIPKIKIKPHKDTNDRKTSSTNASNAPNLPTNIATKSKTSADKNFCNDKDALTVSECEVLIHSPKTQTNTEDCAISKVL